jgi:hypothetical protein
MNSLLVLIISVLFLTTTIYAKNIPNLAKELNLQAGTKASIQWRRVFSSPRHMKRYKVDTLSLQTRNKLEKYLIMHAADSDQPIVPGL